MRPTDDDVFSANTMDAAPAGGESVSGCGTDAGTYVGATADSTNSNSDRAADAAKKTVV